jgi:hypothetical protein
VFSKVAQKISKGPLFTVGFWRLGYGRMNLRDRLGGEHMNGRLAGVGGPILGGAFLLLNNISESTLFSEGSRATTHSARAALGAFLLILGLVFLFKNLK